MVTKFSGYSEPTIDMHPHRMAASITIRANVNPGDVPCAIVIGESRVFTESEVMAILKAIDAEEQFTGLQYRRLVEAGIVLYPA